MVDKIQPYTDDIRKILLPMKYHLKLNQWMYKKNLGVKNTWKLNENPKVLIVTINFSNKKVIHNRKIEHVRSMIEMKNLFF